MSRIRFSFPTGSDAWAAMRQLELANVSCGYPTAPGGYRGNVGLVAVVSDAAREAAIALAFSCGAETYSTIWPR